LGAHVVARYPEPPAALVLDLDPTDDPTPGPQELAFYNHDEKHDCSVPLLIFAGLSGAWVLAGLRPGTRPIGAEHALLCVRLLAVLRRHGPQTPLLVRGASHGATPAVIAVLAPRHRIDGGFGLAGHAVLLRHAAPLMPEARRLHQQRTARAQAHRAGPPTRSRLDDAFPSAAAAWAAPGRGMLTAAVLAAGDTPRCVVTAVGAPTPPRG